MHKPKQKYLSLKKCFLALGLLVYLAVTFHHEIFEGIHILSHQLSGDYIHHSHNANHKETDHNHELLQKLKTALEAQQQTPFTQEKQTKTSIEKKYFLNFFIDLPDTFTLTQKGKISLRDQQLPANPYLQIITPPPQLHI